MTPERQLVEAAYDFASRLPQQTVDVVAEALAQMPWETLQAELTRRVPHHHHRDLSLQFVARWKSAFPHLSGQTVAIALRTAALSEQTHRSSQSVELVWTGPDTGETLCRRTEQAILQVLDSARERITLVSFAVYRIPNIADALIRAARRGVKITVIVETPDRIEGAGEYSTLQALGPDVAACSTVYFWPRDQRPVGDQGKVGLLHVKCVVADGLALFISSANLTRQAFTINMELGLLIRGGSAPGRVERLFDGLVEVGVLRGV